MADREALFSDIDFDKVHEDLGFTHAQFRAYAALLNEQRADGWDFLTGSSPSMADIHAFSVPWATRARLPEVNDLLASLLIYSHGKNVSFPIM